jgi:hypothetical protein
MELRTRHLSGSFYPPPEYDTIVYMQGIIVYSQKRTVFFAIFTRKSCTAATQSKICYLSNAFPPEFQRESVGSGANHLGFHADNPVLT